MSGGLLLQAGTCQAQHSEWGPTTSQCCKGSGNVPTFRQLTHNPTMREKRKELERAGGLGGGGVWGRGSTSDTACHGSLPQNASALSPSSPPPSTAALGRLSVRSLAPGSGQPRQVEAPSWASPSTPSLNEGVGGEAGSFQSSMNSLLAFSLPH